MLDVQSNVHHVSQETDSVFNNAIKNRSVNTNNVKTGVKCSKPSRKRKRRYQLRVGTYNVVTLNDADHDRDRLTRLNDDMKNLGLDVLMITEAKLKGTGSLELADFVLYWSGHKKHKKHGVAIAVRKSLNVSSWEFVSERIMTLEIQRNQRQGQTETVWKFIGVYAPTNCSSRSIKEQFYIQLRRVMRGTQRLPYGSKVVIGGDFNARISRDVKHEAGGIIGGYGLRNQNCNHNGRLLIEFCKEFDLCTTLSFFKAKKHRSYGTWRHRSSKKWFTIDHILVKRRDLRLINNCYVDKSIDKHLLNRDHCLLMLKIATNRCRFYQPKGRKKVKPIRGFHYQKVIWDEDTVRDQFRESVEEVNRLARAKTEIGEEFLIDDYHKHLIKMLDKDVRLQRLKTTDFKYGNWKQESKEYRLLERKNRKAYEFYKRNPSRSNLKKLKTTRFKIRQLSKSLKSQAKWQKVEDIQYLIDTNRSFERYRVIDNMLFGSRKKEGIRQLRKPDGSLTKMDDDQENCSVATEYVKKLLNLESKADVSEEDLKYELPIDNSLDNGITLGEILVEIRRMKLHKSGGPGVDDEIDKDLDIEVLKYICEDKFADFIQKQFNLMLDGGTIPRSILISVMHLLFKKKDRLDCNNYRGLTLSNLMYKLLMRIIYSRVYRYAERMGDSILQESQAGFREDRNCSQQNYALNEIRSLCRKRQMDLYIGFIDIKKAYDSVDREVLWKILQKVGLPPKIISLIKRIYEESKIQLRINSATSDYFSSNAGLKQGCPLSPLLFAIYFGYIGKFVHEELDNDTDIHGVKIVTVDDPRISLPVGADQHLHLQLPSDSRERSEHVIRELLFADDAAILAENEASMQTMMFCYGKWFSKFGLQVAIQKTEIMLCRHCIREVRLPDPVIKMYDTNGELKLLVICHKFKYLGMLITDEWDNMKAEVERRLMLAEVAYQQKVKELYTDNHYTRLTKLLFLRETVMPAIFYGIDIWNLKSSSMKKIESWRFDKYRSVLGIKRSDHIPKVHILEKLRGDGIMVYPLEVLVAYRRLKFFGEVARMEKWRLTKIVHYGTVVPHVGEPKKMLMGMNHTQNLLTRDQIHHDLKLFDIDLTETAELCQHEYLWEAILVDARKKATDDWIRVMREEREGRIERRKMNNNNNNSHGSSGDSRNNRRKEYVDQIFTNPIKVHIPEYVRREKRSAYPEDTRKTPPLTILLGGQGFFSEDARLRRQLVRKTNGRPLGYRQHLHYVIQVEKFNSKYPGIKFLPVRFVKKKNGEGVYGDKVVQTIVDQRHARVYSQLNNRYTWAYKQIKRLKKKHKEKVEQIEENMKGSDREFHDFLCSAVTKNGTLCSRTRQPDGTGQMTIYCRTHQKVHQRTSEMNTRSEVSDRLHEEARCEAITKSKNTVCGCKLRTAEMKLNRRCGKHLKALRRNL